MIVSAVIDGLALDDARKYSGPRAFTDFMATGGDGLALSHAALTEDSLGIVDLDALIAYMQSQPGGIVRADATHRLAPVSR